MCWDLQLAGDTMGHQLDSKSIWRGLEVPGGLHSPQADLPRCWHPHVTCGEQFRCVAASPLHVKQARESRVGLGCIKASIV